MGIPASAILSTTSSNSVRAMLIGSWGPGWRSWAMPKKSAMRRRATYPARMQRPARGSGGWSTAASHGEAASSTVPAATTQERSGWGDRNQTRAG